MTLSKAGLPEFESFPLVEDEFQVAIILRGVRMCIYRDDLELYEEGSARALLSDAAMGITIPTRYDLDRMTPSGREGVAIIPTEIKALRKNWITMSTGTVYWAVDREDVTIFKEKLWPGEIETVKAHLEKIDVVEDFDQPLTRKAILAAVRSRRRDPSHTLHRLLGS
jgi:hypothetical protein